MEKASSGETDLDEWEYIPDDGDDHGFLDIQLSREMGFDQKDVIDMNYFICPSPTASRRVFDASQNSSVPIQIRLQPLSGKNPDHEFVKDIAEVPIAEMAEKIIAPTLEAAVSGDQDMISHVFFKKLKENEFVDMKMDSPKSGNTGIKLQPELGSIQFEEKDAGFKGEAKEHNKLSSKVPAEQEMVKNDYSISKIKEESNWEENGGDGFCFWKLGLSGVGALCSVGVAAATICIFMFGNHKRHKHHQNQKKLRFQIYADDKRIKEMVNHATKLNHALSSVRGVPLTRATISFGGYYDGL
ncbi:uncharacterized protein LOC122642231 isoform X2 [Telopea speciosissima]|uniref:uncharacterized protein LOC122642231 isoform X2 n=1 Tax=Telopea speciosissima TaxID=54955 RepID=UPI001CC4E468|nr:uncharacterized protein LOC122642231 isoform X2 [Telopea speciosissima]